LTTCSPPSLSKEFLGVCHTAGNRYEIGRQKRLARRRGATLVETAVVVTLFFILVFGILDFGLAVLRYHLVGQVARQCARRAIVHGNLADRLGTWGPGDYSGTGDDAHPISQSVQSSLIGLDSSDVQIQVQWIDGSNEVETRVRVTVTAPYQPMTTFIIGNPTLTLRATSTMPIAH
jgi:Flp pilus assembly protein TadG